MDLKYLNCTSAKINQFNKKGIYSVEDLVAFFPRKYYDFRNPVLAKDIKDGEISVMVLDVLSVQKKQSASGRQYVYINCKDSNLTNVNLLFFNQMFISNLIHPGRKYLIGGKASKQDNSVSFINPFLYTDNVLESKKMYPVYSKIQGMADSYLKQKINIAIQLLDVEDYMEIQLQSKYKVIPSNMAKIGVHSPSTPEIIEKSKKRYMVDDLFLFNFLLEKNRRKHSLKSDIVFHSLKKTNKYLKNLPFKLTQGQQDTIKEMIQISRKGNRINALVQGDVGSGKTEVCKVMSLMAIENGAQVAVMVPTQVLAKQHFNDFSKTFADLGINIALLHGKLKKREKTAILKGLADGTINVVVGTHSVISKDVVFKNLGMFIVDEEHKFGVEQREKIEEKANEGIHCIKMSATPIPRTLACALYGDDIQVLTIKTMPTGRKPIITKQIENVADGYQQIKSELKKGHQAYIVCPLIEDSDSDRMQDVESLESTAKEAEQYLRGFKIGIINGKMSEENIQSEIKKFLNKEYDVLVSTTIIEVGVNVPNATVILIKSAERFGLAQMHQLRGRVGRSDKQSYCILSANTKTDESIAKINAMIETSDGFKIAEQDLKIRGAGDFIGTSQSGDNKYIALMLANQKLNDEIKSDIKQIFEDEERLKKYSRLLNISKYEFSK